MEKLNSIFKKTSKCISCGNPCTRHKCRECYLKGKNNNLAHRRCNMRNQRLRNEAVKKNMVGII